MHFSVEAFWDLILIFFLLSFFAQSYFLAFRFGNFFHSYPSLGNSCFNEQPLKVSVIVAARNEALNLKELLPVLLGQDYPNFEVVVVNDRSTDGSSELLARFSRIYSQLKVVEIVALSTNTSPKKAALQQAIAEASGELLLFTDADCRPCSQHWIRTMVNCFGEDTQLVLGVSLYKKEKGLLNSFIQWETFMTAALYISFARTALPYMGVGRNLACKKSFFIEKGGYSKHLHIWSGDDDLLVNQMGNGKNTAVCTEKQGQTVSFAPKSWLEWWRQKTRHLSTGIHYRPKVLFYLGLFQASGFLFYFAGFLLLSRPEAWAIALVAFFLRGIWFILVLRKANQTIEGQQSVVLSFWVYDLLYHIYLVVIGIAAFFRKKNSWK